jgi:hypothetical protein
MNADGVCFGDQTSNRGTGSAELLLFVIGKPAGVALLTLAPYAGAYPRRYVWL